MSLHLSKSTDVSLKLSVLLFMRRIRTHSFVLIGILCPQVALAQDDFSRAPYSQITDPKLHRLVEDIVNKAQLKSIKSGLIGLEVNAPLAGSKWTPLCFAVAHANVEATQLLLSMKANPNIDAGKGKSLLMLSSHYGDERVTAMLIRAGASINQKDDRGFSAFTYAAIQHRYPYRQGYRQIIEMLLDHGAKPQPAEIALAQNTLPLPYQWGSKWVETKGKLTQVSITEEPEAIATRKLMDRLFRLGPDFNAEVKVKAGQEPIDNDEEGVFRTGHPIEFACKSGDLDMLKMAIRYTPGWKKWVLKEYDGPYNLADIARKYRNEHIVRFLKRKGVVLSKVSQRHNPS